MINMNLRTWGLRLLAIFIILLAPLIGIFLGLFMGIVLQLTVLKLVWEVLRNR